MKMRTASNPVFLFSLIFLLFSNTFPDIEETVVPVVDSLKPPISDSALQKGTPVPDVLSPTTGPAGKKDSLKEGRRDTVDVRPKEKRFFGGHLIFLIPISKTLDKIRSESENIADRTRMDQDAEDRFDENDIAFPVGLDFRFRWLPWLEPAIALSAFHTNNSNGWTPKTADTLATGRHVNAYSITGVHAAIALQLNIPPDILTLNDFHRLYFGFSGDFYPLAYLHTERTLLSGGVRARGYGWGGSVSVGAEKFLDRNASLFGEMGFGMRTLGGFAVDGRKVAEREVLVSGGGDALSIDFRALFFKFGYGRWF